MKTQHFHSKLPCQKPNLRQMTWGVKDRPTPKNRVLPLTALFFKV